LNQTILLRSTGAFLLTVDEATTFQSILLPGDETPTVPVAKIIVAGNGARVSMQQYLVLRFEPIHQ
jgi:hypothetical protein